MEVGNGIMFHIKWIEKNDEYKNISNPLIPFKTPLIYVIVDNPLKQQQNWYVECSRKHNI